MGRTKKTLPLREVAAGVMQKADTRGRRHGALAVRVWPEVVGEEIARHTRGFALRERGELVVAVDSSAWANQLSLMAEDLRLRLNAHLDENAVTALRFTVSRKVAEEVAWEGSEQGVQEYYEPEPANPVELDDVEYDQARHVASAIHDPKLREVALGAMVKDLEQKKGARLGRPGTGS
jgi:hypothetical protein